MKRKNFPEIIEVELTSRCNKNCRMCQRTQVEMNHLRPDLDIPLINEILNQVKGREVQVNLGGVGESLMVDQLPLFFERIKRVDPGIKTGVNTNALLLTKEKWQWLSDGRLDYFTISINAPDVGEYLWLTGDDSYELIHKNAIEFLNHKGLGNPPFTTVHCFDLPRFKDKLESFRDYWGQLADHVQVRSFNNWAGTLSLEKFGIEPDTTGICNRPWTSLALDTQGGFHRCCATFQICQPWRFITDVSIEALWNGKEMEDFRERMENVTLEKDEVCFACNAKNIPPNTLIEHEQEQAREYFLSEVSK